jgi:hypothetical protein
MAALDIWTAKKMLSADGELMRLLLMTPPDASDRSGDIILYVPKKVRYDAH